MIVEVEGVIVAHLLDGWLLSSLEASKFVTSVPGLLNCHILLVLMVIRLRVSR